MYILHIANKNYSSWSLRPWVLMRELDIPFQEILHPFGLQDDWDAFRAINPSALVPCLVDDATLVWDSLAIAEFLAERHQGVWPSDPDARRWSRCVASEMHSGFFELRRVCSMNCGVRVDLFSISPALANDIRRIDDLWQDGLTRFGGPFLAGRNFSAADAFFAPVAFRFQTYDINVSAVSAAYQRRLLQTPSMLAWYRDALDERYRDNAHDLEIIAHGKVTCDLRQA